MTLTPTQTPNNPHWPPTTTPSLAGAAHGLHMTETEGSGVGRCVAVLMGGRSGGHQAAVLSAVGFFFRVLECEYTNLDGIDRLSILICRSSLRVGCASFCFFKSRILIDKYPSQLDRNVKIWFVRPKRPDQIKREDKPLFSSGRIHRARVLSISWYDIHAPHLSLSVD